MSTTFEKGNKVMMRSKRSEEKKRAAAFFDDLASSGFGLDQSLFPAMGKRLVEVANIPKGAEVLDVASGMGASLFPAAEQVGASGHVVGTDLAESMVHRTREEIGNRGLAHCEVLLMDANSLEFPDDSFDRILCGFALFFFPQLTRVLREFSRVLKPGGLVAASTFAERGYPWNWYENLLKNYGLTSRDDELIGLVVEQLESPIEIERHFGRAGFSDIEVSVEEFDSAYTNEDDWWNQLCLSLDVDLLHKLKAAELTRFKTDAFKHLQEMKSLDGIHAVYRVLFTRATRTA
ncbi:MAG: class I SAM-dependent methyltransferase [Candidatus Thorarchaeota archaeon]|jgi:O-methyltransferase/aklanonic acid methyltransferase